jgi:ABC-type nickel/cobalt efflux system permease component RcnA
MPGVANAELLLVGAVAGVGVLHTVVPDHWVPITAVARARRWSPAQTARAAFTAGTGHVVSTLLIGLLVWLAGVAFAKRFGSLVEVASSVALIAFGLWIAVGAYRELRHEREHHGGHEHHAHEHHPDPAKAVSSRTALLLILGSSPMIEGIPAFFAAAKYGPALISVMAAVFAIATIATYVLLCVWSAAGAQRLSLGPWEPYGEVLSGLIIALVGGIFLAFPLL